MALVSAVLKPRKPWPYLSVSASPNRRVSASSICSLGGKSTGRVEGHVDHVLADQDQLAADGEVVDGAAVVAGVDDGGGVGGEPAEILRHRQAGIDRLGLLEEGPERDRRRLLARGDELGRGLVDLLVQRIVEMLRLEEARHAVVRLVVDEDGAEQRLLGLDVVGRGAEGQRVGRLGFRRGGGGLAGGCVHARRLSRFRVAGKMCAGPSPAFAHSAELSFGPSESPCNCLRLTGRGTSPANVARIRPSP